MNLKKLSQHKIEHKVLGVDKEIKLAKMLPIPSDFDASEYLKNIAGQDHGTLAGLGDDDHTQYVLNDGEDTDITNGTFDLTTTGHACFGSGSSAPTDLDILCLTETFDETSGNTRGIDSATTLSPSGALTGILRNYAISFNAYWDTDVDGNVGANQALLYGILGQCVVTQGSAGNLYRLSGGRFANYHYGSGTITQMDVVYSLIRNDDADTESGDITNAYNYWAVCYTDKTTGTIGSRYGYHYSDITGGGNVTTQYGLYIESLSGATNNYAIYLAGSGVDNGIFMGTDTNLYRNAANVLKTDDSYIVGGTYIDVEGIQKYENAFTATLVAGNSSVNVTFPTAFGAGVTPVVVVTPPYQTSFWVTNITNTGCTINVGTTNGYNQTLNVIAMETS